MSDSPELHVRLPRELHADLAARAAQQRVSLNLLCVALLAGAVAWNEGMTDQEILHLAAARGLIQWR